LSQAKHKSRSFPAARNNDTPSPIFRKISLTRALPHEIPHLSHRRFTPPPTTTNYQPSTSPKSVSNNLPSWFPLNPSSPPRNATLPILPSLSPIRLLSSRPRPAGPAFCLLVPWGCAFAPLVLLIRPLDLLASPGGSNSSRISLHPLADRISRRISPAALYKPPPFAQNKANPPKPKNHLTLYLTWPYKQNTPRLARKTNPIPPRDPLRDKPNHTRHAARYIQNKPNSPKPKITATPVAAQT